MDNQFVLVLVICLSMFGIISATHANLEYKGADRVQACTGECYEEYVKVNGTPAEIEQRKQALANADEFSSIRSLWAGCAACHGQNGEGMGAFPQLAGANKNYIVEALTAYKNRETRMAQSALMWGQAGQLSKKEIELLGEFIEKGFPK